MITPIPILLYHRVDHSGDPFSIGPDLFDQHLSWLANRGYRSLAATELSRVLADPHAPRPAKAVAITFDDGYADLATEVAPALRRHGYQATAFLITSLCPDEPGTDHEHLSWPEARDLSSEGVLELQSHTHSHGRWDVGPGDTARVMDDIGASIEVLASKLGQPRSRFAHLAWPWGRTCEDWEAAAADLGVTTQYVVQRGAANRTGQHHRLPRLLLDGASVGQLAAWMALLSARPGALAVNSVFGTIRQLRRGAGYR